MKYEVTVSHTSEVTATVEAPANATRAQLREMVLQLCDDGEASFEMVDAETIVRFASAPLSLLELIARVQAGPL